MCCMLFVMGGSLERVWRIECLFGSWVVFLVASVGGFGWARLLFGGRNGSVKYAFAWERQTKEG